MTDDSSIGVTIGNVSHTILCGLCHEPIAYIGEAKGDVRDAGCAFCDNRATVDEVVREVTEYVEYAGQLQINRAARDAAGKSEIMTFKGKTVDDQSHRFIIDFQL